MKKAFRFDLNRCTGCHACILACANENRLPAGKNWRRVHVFNERRHPGLPLVNFSLACNHCAKPACLENCPANAYRIDEKTGAVILDENRCLGCTYCTWVCPFAAPQYDRERGVVEKCTFCLERLAENREPACVACCPTGALQLIDRQSAPVPAPVAVPGFTPTKIEPALEFVPLRRGGEKPESASPPAGEVLTRLFLRLLPTPEKKISLRSEWALLIFTTLAALLSAILFASLVGGYRPQPFLFLGAGAAAMALSTVHLGRKERAWRAVFNWRRSWLSLEIVSFSAFLGLCGLYWFFSPSQAWMGWLAGMVGLMLLVVIDKVYQAALRVSPFNFHSGQAFLTGLYLTGILTLQPLLLFPAGLAKFALYAERKRRFRRTRRRLYPLVSLLRLACGFVLPLLAWLLLPAGRFGDYHGLWVALVIAGDLIDRGEFYEEMDVVTPQRQMLLDVQNALARLGEN